MKQHKQLAIEAAKEAGEILLSLSKQDIKYEMKNAHDILAEGDLKSEEIIIKKIKSAFPDHSIFSEEKGEESHNSEFLWIIDPVDGTINFSRHIEEYCISIALSKNDEVILGVVYQPALRKLFIAEKGQGAYLNEQKVTVSYESELINSLLATDNSSEQDTRKETFNILLKINTEVRHIRIMGSGAMHLVRIAEGQLDLYYKSRFNYWDYAAGLLILQEAGGKVTDFEGNPINRNSKNILASNSLLHNKALEIIGSNKVA